VQANRRVGAPKQRRHSGGEIVMPEAVARMAAVDGGEVVTLDLKGKAEPLTARRIAVAS